MAYGRSTGFKMGGSRKKGGGFSLKSDMKVDKGAGKAKEQAKKSA